MSETCCSICFIALTKNSSDPMMKKGVVKYGVKVVDS